MPWLLCFLLTASACSSGSSQSLTDASVGPTKDGAPVSRVIPSAASNTQALSEAQAENLSSGLRSGSASRVSAVVALPAGKTLPQTFVANMHALKGLRIDPATSRDNGDGTATARARVTNAQGAMSTWTVLLARDSAGVWKVTATALAESAP